MANTNLGNAKAANVPLKSSTSVHLNPLTFGFVY